jgi:hypothetical protein
MSEETHRDNPAWDEIIASLPPGAIKKFTGEGTGIEANLQTFIQNMRKVNGRVEYALQSGCWIEAIVLRHQAIDFWLRVYFVNSSSHPQEPPMQFSHLLKRCKKLGLDSALHARIKKFNDRRVDAVHSFVVGTITYAELKPIARETEELYTDVIIYVLRNAGEAMTTESSHPGRAGFLVNVSATIEELQSVGRI